MKRQLLIYATADNKYLEFALIYPIFALLSNPTAVVEIGIVGRRAWWRLYRQYGHLLEFYNMPASQQPAQRAGCWLAGGARPLRVKCVHYGTERRAEQAGQAQGAGCGRPHWRASMALLRPRPRRGAPEGQGVAAAPCSDFFSAAAQRVRARCAPISSLGVIQPRHLRGRSLRKVSIRRSSSSPNFMNEACLG